MPSAQEMYDQTTVDEVLGKFVSGEFYPKMDCVHHLLFRLDELEIALRWWNKSAMAELELGEAYLEEYVRHCKFMVTIYAFSERELDRNDPTHKIFEPLMPIRSDPNAAVAEADMRAEFWLSREIKPNKKPETLQSISWNLRFGFFANSVLRKYRTIRHYVTRDVGMLSEAAETAKNDFYFYKKILPTYWVGPSVGIPWLEYEESDFYNFAFEAYQDFAKLWKQKEAAEMESEIREALGANPNMYWGLYYYRLKFIQTGKNEFLLKLRDVGESIVRRIDSGESFYFEKELAQAHSILADAVLFSDLRKVEEGIALIESALKKNEQCWPALPNTLYGDLSYEGLLSLFRLYGIFIALQKNETTVSELSEAVKAMLDVQTDWKFRQEYDFHWAIALKFLLFLHLSHLEEMDSEKISSSIEVIDSVIADNFSNPVYTETEIRYFQIAKSILENLGNDAYVPQTEFCLEEVLAPGCELALDVRMFWLVLAYTRTIRMRRFTGKENIYRMVYESLVEMGRMRPTFSQLDEQSIRDVLCDKLNSKMRTHVARTEVKKWKGKTDICVESKNPNEPMFQIILECLIWKGGEYYAEKKRQLLGYLDVTDTDAGLVTFSKNGDFKAVLEKSKTQLMAERDYVSGSVAEVGYVRDLHNFVLSSRHENAGWKIIEFKHFFIDLA